MLRLSPPGDERFFQTPSLRTWFGGSEANVAVGLAHLGTPAAYVTRLPTNAIGDAALAVLRAEGLDTSHILRGGPRMGIYYVESGADLRPMRVVYDRAGSSFSQLDAGEVDWCTVLRGADWLHLSGITPALGEGPARAAIAAAKGARQEGVAVSLDLNYRPALWAGRDPRPFVEPLAAASDLLVGNPGAFAAMLGVETPEGVGDELVLASARRVHEQLGCTRVAVTRREVHSASRHGWNASLFDAATGQLHTGRRYDVNVVDRVGGGDSFVAGLLHALRAGNAPARALEFATAASALKLTIPGDFNRVSADEVDRLLASLA
ncbi:MAG: sugar kinase [Gemmatimonadota bacterium]|nr:sugar kinase [Gemmatimonadota bacterium]